MTGVMTADGTALRSRGLGERGTADGFRISPETSIGHVHLQISDLAAGLRFFHELLGFHKVCEEGTVAMLSATGRVPIHLVLTQRAGARRKPPRTTGLYHIAIRYPSRQALAATFQRLVESHWPFQGFADHLVSEALYLADADGNGVELYVDRPRSEWQRRNGQIAMATERLDVEGLLAEAEPWAGIDPRTEIGHIHLQVSDLSRAEVFYQGLLGLDVTQRGYPGALFLSAGGYHHHLGVNVWAGVGAPAPPAEAVGLKSFSFWIPDGGAREVLLERARRAGLQVEAGSQVGGMTNPLIRDPDGIGVELIAAAEQRGAARDLER